jgi:hypothetical protein
MSGLSPSCAPHGFEANSGFDKIRKERSQVRAGKLNHLVRSAAERGLTGVHREALGHLGGDRMALY